MGDSGCRRFPDDYTIAELHAIATRAVANGDDYARELLREQLEREEFDAGCRWPSFSVRLPKRSRSRLKARVSTLIMTGKRGPSAADLDPGSFVDQLYNSLVETGPERAGLSAAHLSESVLNRLEIGDRVIRNYVLEIQRPSGALDSVQFDYRFDNGAMSLMQRVALIHEDERSWDSAHAAAWSFEQVKDYRPRPTAHVQRIALVKSRAGDPKLRRQVAVLADLATVVDVGDEEQATAQLGDLLGLRSGLVLR